MIIVIIVNGGIGGLAAIIMLSVCGGQKGVIEIGGEAHRIVK